MSTHLVNRSSVAVALVAALGITLTTAVGGAGATTIGDTVVLPYQATGWTYQETESSDTSFFAPGYDDSGWSTGQAAFGDAGGACSFDVPGNVNTAWNGPTYLDARHHFTVPANTGELQIVGTIDNDATVAINGAVVDTVSSGSCAEDTISATVPASALSADNVVAVLAQNEGGPDYLDLQITAIPAAPSRPVVTGLDPSSGPLGGGNEVVIHGSGFTDVDRVLFKDVNATYIIVSDSEIDATAPEGAKPGVVQVRVHGYANGHSLGQSARSAASRYRYLRSSPTLAS